MTAALCREIRPSATFIIKSAVGVPTRRGRCHKKSLTPDGSGFFTNQFFN